MQNSLSQNRRVDLVLHYVKKVIISLFFHYFTLFFIIKLLWSLLLLLLLFFIIIIITIVIISIIIIIIIIIIIVLLNASLIQPSTRSFAWDLRQMKGGMPHYLRGKILAGNYLIRGSSESSFGNMWGVLVSTIFCIFCSNDLPEIWSIKFWVLAT